MKFANQLMSDDKVQFEKIGTFATRSSRNKWAETIEPIIRKKSPYPISYDVNAFSRNMSNLNFSEFTYTELLGGIWVGPQCMDITCRMIQDASRIPSDPIDPDQIHSILADKYDLKKDLGKWEKVRKVVFMPGHNLLNLASIEIISRVMFENDDVYIKPHPITHEQFIQRFGEQFGWNKVIEKEVSGNSLLLQCDEIYTTSCTEMTVSGALLGKKVINVTNFSYEGYGAYLPISRLIWKMQPESGIRATQEMLHRIFQCPWSGIYFPFHQDIESRVDHYFIQALEYRERYKPLQPIWHPKEPMNKPPSASAPAPVSSVPSTPSVPPVPSVSYSQTPKKAN